MKNLFTLLVFIAFLSPNEGMSQLTDVRVDDTFTQESITGKYQIVKADLDDVQIIFRNDRIEIFEKLSPVNETRTFLLFDGCTPVEPELTEMVMQSEEQITNRGMAEMLNASNMMVKKFKKLVYKNLYPGTELHVSVDNGKVRFDLLDESGELTALPIRDWSGNALVQNSSNIDFINHTDLTISSDTNQLELTESKFELASSTKSNARLSSFEIKTK